MLRSLQYACFSPDELDDSRWMDDYEELEHLGRGAFGEVLLMKQKSTGLLCAVKRLTKQSLTAAEEAEHLSEVKALQALQHPCILKYYGSLEGKESLSLVMEYADAGDLQQLLRRQADAQALFEAVTLFAIFAQLVVAVAHAHKHRVLHRDLKPSNVMLTSSGVLKLGDFGVAKVLAGTTACDQMTCVGSPTYMAPEIVSGEPYGSPCDVWSLGVILYELSSFRKPFEGRSLGEIVMRISSGKFAAVGTHLADRPGGRAIEEAVNPLIARMLVSEAKRRAKMPEVLCTPALQLFVQSLRSSAVVVASAIKSSKEPESSEGAMLDAAVADALLPASGTSPSSPSSAPTAPASKDRSLPPPVPGGKGEVRSSLVSKASKKEVEEDSLAFSLTSDGNDSSASSRMASLLRKSPDGEVSFNLTATDATNVLQLSATKRVRGEAPGGAASSSSKAELQQTAGHGRSQDAAALRSVLGDVLEEESGSGFPEGEEEATWDATAPPVGPGSSSSFRSDDTLVQSQRAAAASSTLSGTRAMEAAVLQDAMGGSRTLDGADARSQKHVLQDFGGTQELDGFVNPSWKISTRTRGHGSGFSSGSSSPSNAGSPPWSSEGGSGGERLPPGRPGARPTPSYKAQEKPSPSHVARPNPGGVPGAPSLSAAGDRAVRGSQPQQVKIQARSQPSAYEVVQRKPSRGSSRSSQSQDNDRSVTWPQIEVHVPDMRHKLPRGAGGVASQQQQPRVHLRSTTPPAGRPSTPDSARQARLERERLRSGQRNGALTIPFFDKPTGGSQPSPPQGFLDRMSQHQRKQEKAASEDTGRSGAAARKTLPATRSQPTIQGGQGAGASPSPSRNVDSQDGRRHSSLGR